MVLPQGARRGRGQNTPLSSLRCGAAVDDGRHLKMGSALPMSC